MINFVHSIQLENLNKMILEIMLVFFALKIRIRIVSFKSDLVIKRFEIFKIKYVGFWILKKGTIFKKDEYGELDHFYERA